MISINKYTRSEEGSVSIEASFVITIMIVLTLGAFEFAYGFFQYNTAQTSARIGARLAATTQPVSEKLETMTGLEKGAQPGDPMPDYSYICDGASERCSEGEFNQEVFDEILFGPDNDGVCGTTEKARRGICDIFAGVGRDNVEIEYRSSGLGRAGNPATPAPIITVTLKDLEYDFALTRYFTSPSVRKMPEIRVTVVGEDLRSGA